MNWVQWAGMGTCVLFVVFMLFYCVYYTATSADVDDRVSGIGFVFVMLFILYGLAGAFGIPI